MKTRAAYIKLGIVFILLSCILYFIHFLIFKDAHHIYIYLLGDIAFLPVEVLLVSVVFHKVLEEKEKKARLKKINMMIGVFFSEAGTKLLSILSLNDKDIDEIRNELIVRTKWSAAEFKKVSQKIKLRKYHLQITNDQLCELKEFLVSKRDALLKILENPNLIEHETFTELIMAVFHLAEELIERKDLQHSCDKDHDHIIIDAQRAYKALILEWLSYMGHLHAEYPFLFSFAIRTNPFDKDAKVEIDQ